MKILVADTAPLIFLAKLTLLDALCERISLIVPREVAEEATQRQELPDAAYIRKLINNRRISVARCSPACLTAFQRYWGLSRGESAALLLAQTRHVTILMDDYAAMRVAKALRLSFVTTPLVIVEMKNIGLISLQAAKVKLDRLQDFAWITPDILVSAHNLLKGGKL